MTPVSPHLCVYITCSRPHSQCRSSVWPHCSGVPGHTSLGRHLPTYLAPLGVQNHVVAVLGQWQIKLQLEHLRREVGKRLLLRIPSKPSLDLSQLLLPVDWLVLHIDSGEEVVDQIGCVFPPFVPSKSCLQQQGQTDLGEQAGGLGLHMRPQ